jgi:hypothetical protein
VLHPAELSYRVIHWRAAVGQVYEPDECRFGRSGALRVLP